MTKSKWLKQTQLHPLSLLNQKEKNANYVNIKHAIKSYTALLLNTYNFQFNLFWEFRAHFCWIVNQYLKIWTRVDLANLVYEIISIVEFLK